MIAENLDDEIVDSFRFIREGISAELSAEKPWVFVAPTYSWQLPRVFVDFIRRGSYEGSVAAYFVMTCGGEIGNAASKNKALCAEKGLCYHGTLQVIMPENYIAMFDAPEEMRAREIISAAQPELERGINCIKCGQELAESKVNIAGRLKSSIIHAAFYRFFVKAKLFAVSGACFGCGKCEKVCPLGNIQLQNNKPVWGDRCTHCMACICGCPAEAIEYGKASCGKPRYQCPEYKMEQK